MRIFVEIKNNRTGFKLADYVTFNILSCCAPVNLWLVRDLGEEDVDGALSHNFTYRKVVSLMEVVCVIDNKEFHGQVASIAMGNYVRLYNVILNLGEEHTDYEWNQSDNPYCYGGLEVYTIDLDELKQSKEYANLSVDECFAKILTNESIGYEILTDRYITGDGLIFNVNERYTE